LSVRPASGGRTASCTKSCLQKPSLVKIDQRSRTSAWIPTYVSVQLPECSAGAKNVLT
jgi:hypothetical protein